MIRRPRAPRGRRFRFDGVYLDFPAAGFFLALAFCALSSAGVSFALAFAMGSAGLLSSVLAGLASLFLSCTNAKLSRKSLRSSAALFLCFFASRSLCSIPSLTLWVAARRLPLGLVLS